MSRDALILIVIVVVLVLSGGFIYRSAGPRGMAGIVAIVLVLVLALWLTGGLGAASFRWR